MEEVYRMAIDEKPKPNREETTKCVHELYRGSRPHSEGPLLVSDFPRTPDTDHHDGVIMGIDEAGRGPILGPMTYAAAYWKEGENIPKGYNDSKQMNASTRSQLFDATLDSPSIGFVIRVLHATEISQCMLRKVNYNLNAMSHDAAMQMVRAVLKMGVKIKRVYIDTVGRESAYKAKLDRAFAGSDIEFVVEKKADAKYVQCSAASVCKCFIYISMSILVDIFIYFVTILTCNMHFSLYMYFCNFLERSGKGDKRPHYRELELYRNTL